VRARTISATLLFLAVTSLATGCSPAQAPELAPAEPDGDNDVVAAHNSRFEPVDALPGDPMPALGKGEQALFDAGKEEFDQVEDTADGLGPVFNDSSCTACHSAPASGGGSETLETRFGAVTNGAFDPLAQKGGSLIQVKGIGVAGSCNFTGEKVPPDATVTALRRTTPLFGLGLVDAVPDSTFEYVARIEAFFFPQQAGRPSRVQDIALGRTAVGRFGWKAQVPSLHQFAGDAYLNEMGVTNPEFPNENCPGGDCTLLAACNPAPGLNDDGSGVVAFENFMTFLAPARRAGFGSQAIAGRKVFESTGCTRCHWSTFRTGRARSPALSFVTFHPYSDFMLHDMGSLGDGIEQGDASGTEMRTAPLWGMRFVTRYLHDGRASTLSEAILAHDGQGRAARDRFAALSASDQAALLGFLNSL
jgi:CxxC motif-containing protein (DUF1111 family)